MGGCFSKGLFVFHTRNHKNTETTRTTTCNFENKPLLDTINSSISRNHENHGDHENHEMKSLKITPSAFRNMKFWIDISEFEVLSIWVCFEEIRLLKKKERSSFSSQLALRTPLRSRKVQTSLGTILWWIRTRNFGIHH